MHTHDGDRQLLQVLQQVGVDFQKPREVNFFLVFPGEAEANRANQLLAARQLSGKVSEIPLPWWKRLFSQPQWFLIVTRQMALDQTQIMNSTTLFQQIATQGGGTYDGWEANVMGDQLNMDAFES